MNRKKCIIAKFKKCYNLDINEEPPVDFERKNYHQWRKRKKLINHVLYIQSK